MQLSKLLELIGKIREAHPEIDESEVWACHGNKQIHVGFVGYDRRHKPPRIKLEE